MAITKLNSLAIPDNTIVEADLSYPLTGFSSTGIDDNATSTAITIDASQNVGIGATNPATILDVREESTGGSTQIRLYNTDNSNTTTQTASLFLSPDSRGNGALLFAEKENADFSTSASRDVALVFSPVLNNSQTEAMRITSSGLVGIGTSTPSELLDVGDHTAVGNRNIRISQRTGTSGLTYGGLEFYMDNTAGTEGVNAAIKYATGPLRNDGELTFHTGASGSISERLRIDHNGNVGIGTSSPSYPLDVVGPIRINHVGSDTFATIRGPGNRDLRIDIDANGDTDSFIVRDLRDGSERFTVQAGGNVGIGTTSPSTSLDVVRAGVQPLRLQSTSGTEVAINMVNTGGNVQLEAHSGNFTIDADNVGIGYNSPDQLLHIHRNSSAGAWAHFTNNTTGATGSNGFLIGIDSNEDTRLVQYENKDMEFYTNNTERMRILAGGGLTFNGDTATANALDDYEEGTWTPALNSGTATVNGRYTKIGRQVFIQASLVDWSDYTSSIDISIAGLPFTSSSNSTSTGSVMYRNVNNTAIAQLTPFISDGVSNIRLYISKNAGQGWELLEYDMFDAGLADMYLSISYFV